MPTTDHATKVIGYLRVSPAELVASGYGLKAQEHAIREALERRDWELAELIRDEGESGKSLERPGLQRALEAIAAGDVDGLVVAKLDRLSRSVIDFAELLEWFTEAEATLLALDLDVDTSTPGGRLVANVFASVAEWERDTIAARTSAGLAVARAEGRPIGPPSVSDRPGLAEHIQALRDTGLSYRAVAEQLNAEGVPTVRGGTIWRGSSVQTALGYRRRRRRRRRASLPTPNARS
jgi:DNA invertase Pin-like site-specific DNA recombinase